MFEKPKQIGVKRKKELSDTEKRYLQTLEPFILIRGAPKDCWIDTRWYSGKGKNERWVYRLDPFSNLGQNALVSDSLGKVLSYGVKVRKKKFEKREEEEINKFVFVPLSNYLKYKDDIPSENLDLKELKEKWGMEILSNVLIRIKIGNTESR